MCHHEDMKAARKNPDKIPRLGHFYAEAVAREKNISRSCLPGEIA
jgi:hypothetical protein